MLKMSSRNFRPIGFTSRHPLPLPHPHRKNLPRYFRWRFQELYLKMKSHF